MPARKRYSKALKHKTLGKDVEKQLLVKRLLSYYHLEKLEERLEKLVKNLKDEDIVRLITEVKPSTNLFFHGEYYTLADGTISLSSSEDYVKARVKEALRRWEDRAYYILKAGLELRDFDKEKLKEKMRAMSFPHLQPSLLGWLESFHLLIKTDGRWVIPEEEKGFISEVLSEYEPKFKLKSKLARREVEDVLKLEQEFEEYLSDLVLNRLDETVTYGENFDISKLVSYLRGVFGSFLYYDILLAIVQQYAIADVPIMTEARTSRLTTGFNLALFGEPGTGKTFATVTMILGNAERGIPAHGLPGRNRYCGGMTPAKFIRIGEAYEGRKYNFIVPEFNDWFKYRGMVEPLKIAMEHGKVKWETAHGTIGPYRFTSFLSVNYNTRVFKRGYEVTVKDPNFVAIEERMLCRLHRLTKNRYREVARKQMELTLGKLRMVEGPKIRDHLTLVHAIETEHPALSDTYKPKPILLEERVYNAVERAREAILNSLSEERLEFSPRLEARAVQLACAMSIPSYFKTTDEVIRVEDTALKLAVQFYVEEAAIRSKEAFNPKSVLFDLGIPQE